MNNIGINAKQAAESCQLLSTAVKNDVLLKIGASLVSRQAEIIKANQKDIEHAQRMGMSQPLLDRLTLHSERIEAMKTSIEQLVDLEDPIGEILEARTLDNGLRVEKIRVPLGVIGIIYESRPNVTVDAFALCFKAGNAVILKGGKEAIHSNTMLETILRDCLLEHGLNPNIIQVIKSIDRASTQEMMKMNQYIDVLIPRGSNALIQAVVTQSTIPVLETGAGNCHIYIDSSFDTNMAIDIIKNAKLQRLGVCNAAESLVVHKDSAPLILPLIYTAMPTVTFYGDKQAKAIIPQIETATPQDFDTEYLDTKMSIAVVDSLETAIKHINKHSTHHSEAIITNNTNHAEIFLNEIDSACVYLNASTRFTDGFEMGLGAEIGISTQKLHARGPMGLKELTSYKYKVYGNGQVR